MSIFGRRYKLVSPLTPREICLRLEKTVGWPLFSDRRFVGYYDRGGFQLRVRVGIRNSFQTILYGTFTDKGDHTHIDCLAGPRRFVLAFTAIWLLGVITIGSMIALSSFNGILAGNEDFGSNVLGVVIPVAMFAFGIGLFWLGRTLARDEESQLIDFLEEAIDAGQV